MADYPVEFDIELPSEKVIELIELKASELGLNIHRGSLGKYPGCTHWHFQTPGRSGTLEMTYWPKKSRLWLSARSNRHGDWIPEKLEALRSSLRDQVE